MENCGGFVKWIGHTTDSKVRTPYQIIVPCESTPEEVSFEWSHHRISSTDSKVRTTY